MIYFVPYTCYSGLGLDDMFVIVQCWTDIKKDPNMVGLSIADKMGIALKQAAVLVTVSCIAELFVLGVGALTVSMNIIPNSRHTDKTCLFDIFLWIKVLY